jgi:hypothetical protein
MRWIALTIGLLLLSGCSDFAYNVRREGKKIVKSFKDANNSDHSNSSYQYESDASKAHHEQTVVNTLNSWIGNRPYQ